MLTDLSAKIYPTIYSQQVWRGSVQDFGRTSLRSDEILQHEILRKFIVIPQVTIIYWDNSGGEITFWVFTDNIEYDDLLMDVLISKEMEIMHTYPEISILFHYIPEVLCKDSREIVANTGKLIYRG